MHRFLKLLAASSIVFAIGGCCHHHHDYDEEDEKHPDHANMRHEEMRHEESHRETREMNKDSMPPPQRMGEEGATMMKATHAVAVLHALGGSGIAGTVHFMQESDGLHVTADITGLDPDTTHGFHIHEFGDCSSPDGSSAGGHFAGAGSKHGHPEDAFPNRHAGDMGNIKADSSGKAHVDVTLHDVALGGRNGVMGRAVILHAKADDFTGPSGNAGGRIACGVIGAAK